MYSVQVNTNTTGRKIVIWMIFYYSLISNTLLKVIFKYTNSLFVILFICIRILAVF